MEQHRADAKADHATCVERIDPFFECALDPLHHLASEASGIHVFVLPARDRALVDVERTGPVGS